MPSLLLNCLCAVLCWHFAKKRGRAPGWWLVWGFFFTFVPLVALIFLKSRTISTGLQTPRTATNDGRESTRDIEVRADVGVQEVNRFEAANQRRQGDIDLTDLRNAVRALPRHARDGGNSDAWREEIRQGNEEFLIAAQEIAPTLNFDFAPIDVRPTLQSAWLGLAQLLVDTRCGGGVADLPWLYQIDESDVRVEFVPFFADINDEAVAVMFDVDVKRFQGENLRLSNWLNDFDQQNPVTFELFDDYAGPGKVLQAITVVPLAHLTSQTLDETCDLVRSAISQLKHDLPARFGGVWLC